MEPWYATQDLRLFIEALAKPYDCPWKDHRQGDASHGQQPYRRVETLAWDSDALPHGKRIKIKGLPQAHKVHLCRVEGSTHRTDFVVPNAWTQAATEATQEACGCRGKIEPLHRAGKQVTGLERCQCRKARLQRNHSGCAFFGWIRLKELAAKTGRTLYQLTHGLREAYLSQQRKNPSLKMILA
jgi:hypothetical protein